jgi:hypothetical protein
VNLHDEIQATIQALITPLKHWDDYVGSDTAFTLAKLAERGESQIETVATGLMQM